AVRVLIEIGDRQYPMEGTGRSWKYMARIDSIGLTRFRVTPSNEDDKAGEAKQGQITTLKKPVEPVHVAKAEVMPKEGYAGDEFTFRAETDRPATKVSLIIGDKRYGMKGSEATWSLSQEITDLGTIDFEIVAENEDGQEGGSHKGLVVVRAPRVNVVEVKVTPEKAYAGEPFLITARTDRPARAVFLKMDDVIYRMEGSGREWLYRKEIGEIGRKSFTVISRNQDGVEGDSRTGGLLTEKRPPPVPEVATIAVEPKEGYAGDSFVIEVKTTEAATGVLLEIGDRQYPMEGTGRSWKYMARIDSIGITRFRVTPSNEDGKAGEVKQGEVTALKKPVEPVHVAKAEVMPKEGYAGGHFAFKAETNRPAHRVRLIIGEKRYEMRGAGTAWSLSRKIVDLGITNFEMVAENEDGMTGRTQEGLFVVRAPLVQVVEAKTTPGKGQVGGEFLITARTNRNASAVYLKMDGVIYRMEGSKKAWRYRKEIGEIGRKSFTVTARNIEGKEGKSRSGQITVTERRVPVPDVAAISVDPDPGYVGDSFVIIVRTTKVAAKVLIEIEGKRYDMEGAGTEWNYLKPINREGVTPFMIIASNERGQKGKRKEGRFTTKKRPTVRVNVAMAEVIPSKGYSGAKFNFKATTDKSAKGVSLIIGGNRYAMGGSGTEWSLVKRIKKTGDLIFSLIAINKEGEEGGLKTGHLTVEELKNRWKYNKDGTITDIITGEVKKRFVDNQDGTVTDLSTNLMWLKGPKRVAEKWEKAKEYCRNLEHKGYKGWRLPTLDEWKRLIDKTRKNPALPPGHPFSNVVTHYGYWSKTRHTFGPLYVFQANLWQGKTGYQSKKKNAHVWPVRYAKLEQ
ncbi:DUF1566 domain-containing protein, partial [bacterium]|nr:DUF1566 domain-containing protein [bacterium]